MELFIDEIGIIFVLFFGENIEEIASLHADEGRCSIRKENVALRSTALLHAYRPNIIFKNPTIKDFQY